MKLGLIVTLSIIGVVLAGAGYAAYLGNGLQDIKVDQANEKPRPTADGFEIPIKVLVTNPSKISIPISYIEYEGVLESTGEVLTKGSIRDIEITKMQSTWVNETATVKWDKSAAATAELLTQEKVLVKINLKINIFGITIPFDKSIDIKEAIQDQNPLNSIPVDNPTGNLIPQVL